MGNQLLERETTFVNLNNKLLAEYMLIYKVDDGYEINELTQVKNKHQLQFKKFENKNQQLNLMFVDGFFPQIIADLALEVLIKKLSSIGAYISSEEKIKLIEQADEITFFNYKFLNFIHLLLYGDISSEKPFDNLLHTDRVFCFKDNTGELDYFSVYEQKALEAKLINELNIEIDYNSSVIKNQEAKICLKFKY